MTRPRSFQLLFILLILVAVAVLHRRVPEREPLSLVSASMRRVLDERGIRIPLVSLSNVVETAIIKQIDPGARFLARDQALGMQEEWPAVEYSSEWARGMLYVKVLAINDGAFDSITNAMLSVSNSLAGLVLDMRSAGGWSMTEIEKVSSCAVQDGTPLCRIINGYGSHTSTLKSKGPRLIPENVPIVVMIDGDTSGAAEILAGVLSGRKDVVVMGVVTPGMACIREFVALGSGAYLFIATGWADWGKGVHSPVTPDIVVEDNIHRQQIPSPRKVGREAKDLVELLRQTSSDELARRASDLLLSQMRLRERNAE